MELDCAGRRLDLSTPRVMGVLNVTPDSFSDGGRFVAPQQAIMGNITLDNILPQRWKRDLGKFLTASLGQPVKQYAVLSL